MILDNRYHMGLPLRYLCRPQRLPRWGRFFYVRLQSDIVVEILLLRFDSLFFDLLQISADLFLTYRIFNFMQNGLRFVPAIQLEIKVRQPKSPMRAVKRRVAFGPHVFPKCDEAMDIADRKSVV